MSRFSLGRPDFSLRKCWRVCSSALAGADRSCIPKATRLGRSLQKWQDQLRIFHDFVELGGREWASCGTCISGNSFHSFFAKPRCGASGNLSPLDIASKQIFTIIAGVLLWPVSPDLCQAHYSNTHTHTKPSSVYIYSSVS